MRYCNLQCCCAAMVPIRYEFLIDESGSWPEAITVRHLVAMRRTINKCEWWRHISRQRSVSTRHRSTYAQPSESAENATQSVAKTGYGQKRHSCVIWFCNASTYFCRRVVNFAKIWQVNLIIYLASKGNENISVVFFCPATLCVFRSQFFFHYILNVSAE